MNKMFRFAKTAALVLAGAGLIVSCQKDAPEVNNPSVATEDGTVVELKYATEATGIPADKFIKSEWVGSGSQLSFLKESQAIDPSFLQDVPTGIEVKQKTKIYVTYVSTVASFNNVLGYYFYNKEDLKNAADPKEFILNRIFDSSRKGLAFNNVIYSTTKNLNFGTTYELADDNGNEFEAGTVVGFYLLPNSSNSADLTKPIVRLDQNMKPIFIATDNDLNITPVQDGKLSHIMGRSSCGDLVIAFEDRNSMYSNGTTSDEDFNDLAFVIGDSKDSRYTSKLNYYISPAKPFELDDAKYFGSIEDCLECLEDDDDMSYLLDKVFVEGQDKTVQTEFDALFGGDSKQGYLELNGNTNLYAFFKYGNASYKSTIGWYEYKDEYAGMSEDAAKAAIKASVVDGSGYIKPEYLIYTFITNGNWPAKGVAEVLNLGNKFDANKKIGFFINPLYAGQVDNGQYKFDEGSVGPGVRFTTVNSADKASQAQFIMAGACNTLMICFEDKKKNGDVDYNDIIFSISDNNATPKFNVVDIVTGGFYQLSELVDALRASGKYPY